MNLLRKIVIWLLSLLAVLTVYYVYTRYGSTGSIEIDRSTSDAPAIVGNDSNMATVAQKTQVGTLEVARFTELNADKTLNRQWGFSRVVHKRGDMWEIQQPYMNIYRPDVEIRITAEEGTVQVETVAGTKVVPRDATLSTNVVIHIVPREKSDLREAWVCLDKVIFVSNKSQFSTDGTVEFISEDAQMLGRGMRLIYNPEFDRVEFLRILDLKNLCLNTSTGTPFSDDASDSDDQQAGDTQTRRKNRQASKTSNKPKKSQPQDTPVAETYRCLLDSDVTIESDEQVVYADRLWINNIPLQQARREQKTDSPPKKTSSQESSPSGEQKTKPATEKPSPQPASSNTLPPDSNTTPELVIDRSRPKLKPVSSFDVKVCSSRGLLIAPQGSPEFARLQSTFDTAGNTQQKPLAELAESEDRSLLLAQTIHYDAQNRQSRTDGKTEVAFYVKNRKNDPNAPRSRITVRATKSAQYLPEEKRVIFEGDCVCAMAEQPDTSGPVHKLKTPKLTVNLPKDDNDQFSGQADGPTEVTVYPQDSQAAGEESVRIRASKSVEYLPGSQEVVFEGHCICTPAGQAPPARQYELTASKIVMNTQVSETTAEPAIRAAGPVRLKFNTEISGESGEPNKTQTVPVIITASDQARFIPAQNRVLFAGDTTCKMTETNGDINKEYILAGEHLNIKLAKETQQQSRTSDRSLENLTAQGTVVRLSMVEQKGQELLSGVELKCRKFEYDTPTKTMLATGPGVIRMRNNTPPQSPEQLSRFSLKRRCVATVQNFDILKYLIEEKFITAASESDGIVVHYFTQEGDNYRQQAAVTAKRIDCRLKESKQGGQKQLADMDVTGGIFYEDADNILEGQTLHYDADKAIMTVEGGRQQTCYYNGTAVKSIQYNPQTGQAQVEVAGPGAFEVE